MKPDLSYLAPEILAKLSPTQRSVMRVLHLDVPLPQRRSGVPVSTFKALLGWRLVKPGPAEREWLLTDLGAAVKALIAKQEAWDARSPT